MYKYNKIYKHILIIYIMVRTGYAFFLGGYRYQVPGTNSTWYLVPTVSRLL